MKIEGSHTILAPRHRVWDMLHDPDVLARTVPGCQTLEVEGEARFSATLAVGVGPVRGRFNGHVELTDDVDYELYRMSLSGQGPRDSSARGRDHSHRRRPRNPVSVDADAQIGGTLAQIGSRMIQTATRMLMGQFFEALDREARGAEQPG